MSEPGTRRTLGSRVRSLPWLEGLPREVAVLAAVAFCVALGFGIVAPAIPIFAQQFEVTAFWAASVVSVFALMRLIGALPAGWIVDRVGERMTLIVGLTIVAVSSAFAGLSTSFAQLLVLRGIGGLGSAMFTVSALALLIRVAAPEQRGRAAAAFQGGFLLGGVTGPAVGGIVLGISIRLPFFVYAATLGAAVVVVITTMSRTRLLDAPEKPSNAAAAAGRSGWAIMRQAVRDRAYVTALVVNFGSGFTAFGLRSAIVPLFVVNSLGLDPAWAGYGALASAAVQAPLLSRAGRTTDTQGRRIALMLGTGITAIGFLALALTGSLWAFLGAMAVLGAGSAYLGAGPSAVVGDITGGRREGPVVATFQMMSDVGAIAGPLIVGAIVDSTKSYSLGFTIGAVIMLITLAMSATMPETLGRAKAQAATAPHLDPATEPEAPPA
ncbi:MFS transporter [Longivirga aurantiaca]|uniref:MFS transporter n=1 Tax=Longivirga aurantiaca TaxID=1837743 RepID=A0ABW1SZA6_9ACTN